MMTKRIFKSMMNKLSEGEYNANAYEIYDIVCPKSYKNMNITDNRIRQTAFVCMFEECKYGFEYMFNNKIRYIGTNDLNFVSVSK